MDWNKLTDDEKSIAEKAVSIAPAVKLAGDTAPHGKALFWEARQVSRRRKIQRGTSILAIARRM